MRGYITRAIRAHMARINGFSRYLGRKPSLIYRNVYHVFYQDNVGNRQVFFAGEFCRRIDGERRTFSKTFTVERDAALWVDKKYISLGFEPVNILRRKCK